MKKEKNLRDEKTKKIRKKIKLKKSVPIFLFSLLAILIMVIIFFVTYDKYEDLTELKMENYDLYQYLSGVRFDYTGELSFKKDGEVVNVKYNDIEIEVDSTPIYFSKIDNEMIIPLTMGYYIPRITNKNYKLPGFTRIGVDQENYGAYLIKDDGNIELESSFLYDGVDLYVFLFETPITINGQKITLSPLSYAQVVYGGDVIYYNKATDTYKEIPSVNTDVVAEIGQYKLNLSTDMIMYSKQNRLLIKNVQSAPTFDK